MPLLLRQRSPRADVASACASWAQQRFGDSSRQVVGALLVIGRTNPALLAVAAGVVPLLARAMRVVVVRTARRAYRQRNAASDALAFANERLTQVCCRM